MSDISSSMNNKGLPRKLTAVGTIGDVNQLFTVYEKNWNCKDCGQENYPSRLLVNYYGVKIMIQCY